MTALRTLIDGAIGDAIAEHPGYFTDRGKEAARAMLSRKVVAVLRAGLSSKAEASDDGSAEAVPAESPKPVLVERGSREALAYATLRQIAGAAAPFVVGDGRISLPPEAQIPAVLRLADAPSRERWPYLSDRQQVGAWQEFFRETLPNVPRRPVCVDDPQRGWGMAAPWPFPPRKDGTLSAFPAGHAATGDAA